MMDNAKSQKQLRPGYTVLSQPRPMGGMGGGQQPSFFWPVCMVVLKCCLVK